MQSEFRMLREISARWAALYFGHGGSGDGQNHKQTLKALLLCNFWSEAEVKDLSHGGYGVSRGALSDVGAASPVCLARAREVQPCFFCLNELKPTGHQAAAHWGLAPRVLEFELSPRKT